MIDLHNHILRGLDDGARDWQESLSMARLAVEDGIEAVVCTPHWVANFFENTRPMVLEAVRAFREKLADADISLTVYPGSELRLEPDIPRKIQSGELLTINDTGRYALIELHDHVLPQNLEDFFWELQAQEVTPILSHPERNGAVFKDPMRLYRWVEMGALVQITSSSVLGRFGSVVQKFAMTLLDHQLVHVIASDAHGVTSRTPKLSECRQVVTKIMGQNVTDQLFRGNPEKIIRGEPVTVCDSIPFEERGAHFSWKSLFPFWGRR